MQPYLDDIVKEFEAFGIRVTVKEKDKSHKTAMDSDFLQPGTKWKQLLLKDIITQEKIGTRRGIRIKLEVDTVPPPGFKTEDELLG